MHAAPTAIAEIIAIALKVTADEHSFSFESFNARAFAEAAGLNPETVQNNHSRAAKNVPRRVHY